MKIDWRNRGRNRVLHAVVPGHDGDSWKAFCGVKGRGFIKDRGYHMREVPTVKTHPL